MFLKIAVYRAATAQIFCYFSCVINVIILITLYLNKLMGV